MLASKICILLFGLYGCASANSHDSYKKVALPFRKGTEVYVSQGAFGKASHSESGNQYSWDFDVPYGTEVLAVEDGKVVGIWAPEKDGGCDRSYSEFAHNIKIEASDGTVAQYVHIEPRVKVGQLVKRGEVVAVTARNGFICEPQLHFGIYQSRDNLYTSPTRKTLPVLFDGLPGGVAKEGLRFTAN
jgi:murein DD-endopeptidase MepM/ murein hydrolase activator NlpD